MTARRPLRTPSSPVRPVGSASSAPARTVARVLAIVLGLLLCAPVPASAAGGSAVAATTRPGPRDTSGAPAPAHGSGTPGVVAADASPPGVVSGTSQTEEDRKVWAVVGGLVAVALALSLLTLRYWRHTRPVPPPVPFGDEEPAPAEAVAAAPTDSSAPTDPSDPTEAIVGLPLAGLASEVDRTEGANGAAVPDGVTVATVPGVNGANGVGTTNGDIDPETAAFLAAVANDLAAAEAEAGSVAAPGVGPDALAAPGPEDLPLAGSEPTEAVPAVLDDEPVAPGPESLPGLESLPESLPGPEVLPGTGATSLDTGPASTPSAVPQQPAGPVVGGEGPAGSTAPTTGTDHAGVDDDWEPHATGEQPAVAAAPVRRVSRPDRGQRAAALTRSRRPSP